MVNNMVSINVESYKCSTYYSEIAILSLTYTTAGTQYFHCHGYSWHYTIGVF